MSFIKKKCIFAKNFQIPRKMFSKSCQYALRAVLFLAVNRNAGHKYNVKEIAQELGLPMHFLGKLLQQLSRDQIISSIKGPSGGFFMTEENLEIPVMKIVQTIDGPDALRSCLLGLRSCSESNPCPLHGKAASYRDGLRHMLSDSSILKIAERIEKEGLKI